MVKTTKALRELATLIAAFYRGEHAQIATISGNPDLERYAFNYNPDGSTTLPNFMFMPTTYPDKETIAAIWALAEAALHQHANDQAEIAKLREQNASLNTQLSAYQRGLNVVMLLDKFIGSTYILRHQVQCHGAVLELRVDNLLVTYTESNDHSPQITLRSNTAHHIGEKKFDVASGELTIEQIDLIDKANYNAGNEGFSTNTLTYGDSPAMLAQIYPQCPASEQIDPLKQDDSPHGEVIDFFNPCGTAHLLEIDPGALNRCKTASVQELIQEHPQLVVFLSSAGYHVPQD